MSQHVNCDKLISWAFSCTFPAHPQTTQWKNVFPQSHALLLTVKAIWTQGLQIIRSSQNNKKKKTCMSWSTYNQSVSVCDSVTDLLDVIVTKHCWITERTNISKAKVRPLKNTSTVKINAIIILHYFCFSLLFISKNVFKKQQQHNNSDFSHVFIVAGYQHYDSGWTFIDIGPYSIDSMEITFMSLSQLLSTNYWYMVC